MPPSSPASPTVPTSACPADIRTRIDQHIAAQGGWRSETLAQVRALVHAAVPDVVEEWKWDIPVWSSQGILCTGESYKKAVKLTFPHGASLPDPAGLFNASLEGKVRRAIDLPEGHALDATAFKTLLRAAADFNASKAASKPAARKKKAAA